jgi:hypothetical protein
MSSSSHWDETKNKWIGISRYENAWDATGHMTLYLTEQWDTITSQWIDYSKIEYEYDSNGNCILYNSYRWNINTSQWVIFGKGEITYTGGTVETEYVWDTISNQWINSYKLELNYDANGNMTLSDYYFWNDTTDMWVGSGQKNIYYYSEYNFIDPNSEKQIRVYPNPASEYIVFEVSDLNESAVIEIFDNQGKKVLDQKLSYTRQIYIGNLGKGLYLYRINNSGNIYKGKIIVQ